MPTAITKNKFITNILSNDYNKVCRTISRCPKIVQECITDGRNPLHKAVYQIGYMDIVKILLDSGADVNQCESNINVVFNGTTPLLKAMDKGDLNFSIVKILLEYGANVNRCDYHNTSPLYLAIKQRNIKIANLLLEYGADVNICNDTNTSPLQLAAAIGNSQIVQALLERGANVNAETTTDNSPLYLAAVRWADPLFAVKKEKYASVIKILIEYGADVNTCSICLQNIH
jgi:ankyrin repeat protein